MAKKVAQLLAQRRSSWQNLNHLCDQMERGGPRRLGPEGIEKFTSLYRSACADLALADAYQLPQDTIAYLHQLVARAHNQLYRSRRFQISAWADELFIHTPRRLLRDGYLRLSSALFFGLMGMTMLMAYIDPSFAEALLGRSTLEMYQSMYADGTVRSVEQNSAMMGFYVQHNAGIGLRCFAMGLLGGVGGLVILVTNACQLGPVFGYMAGTEQSGAFLEFVTAHGPFELTAIALSAAAGMRLGFSVVFTQGLSRGASLQKAARESVPIISVAVIFFIFAAILEGFVSPTTIPFVVKAGTSILSALAILAYIVVLGWPPSEAADATG
jgi:uncharacterized membrane protein SpoIIM required for sporulation